MPGNDGGATARSEQAAVSATQLSKSYGSHLVLDRLSFEIPAGRIFGFLGPNGAGKTTTLGCLTGLLEPSSGEVRLLGSRFDRNSVSLKRRIGVMPQELALFDQLYAHEFLLFNAEVFGMSRTLAKERIDELLLALDLGEGSFRKPLCDFSTGMRKKVAFAAAVLHVPDILFLDEPFEGIDPQGVANMKGWLRAYVSRGKTVFLTSHILETVERLCDEAAIIHGGALAWRGALSPSAGLEVEGRRFSSLEELFLKITDGRTQPLSWL